MGWFYVFIIIPNPERDLEVIEKMMEQESCCVETVWKHNAVSNIYQCIRTKDGRLAVLCGGGEKVYSFGQDKTYANGSPIRYAEIPVMDAYDWDRWSKQNTVLKLTKWEMISPRALAEEWPRTHDHLAEVLKNGIVAFLLSVNSYELPLSVRTDCVKKIIQCWDDITDEKKTKNKKEKKIKWGKRT
jgi:hypothetical protein